MFSIQAVSRAFSQPPNTDTFNIDIKRNPNLSLLSLKAPRCICIERLAKTGNERARVRRSPRSPFWLDHMSAMHAGSPSEIIPHSPQTHNPYRDVPGSSGHLSWSTQGPVSRWKYAKSIFVFLNFRAPNGDRYFGRKVAAGFLADANDLSR